MPIYEDTQTDGLEGQTLEELIAKAADAAAKGENVDQILEVMLTTLPVAFRDKARKQFAAALAKRGLKQPTGEADIPSRATLSRIRQALAISARQMMDRIATLVRSRPDIAATIQQAGRVLASNGVMSDKASISEGDLGTIAPSSGVGKVGQQDRGNNTRA